MNVKRLNQGESHLADKSLFGRLTNVPFMSRVELKAKIVKTLFLPIKIRPIKRDQ